MNIYEWTKFASICLIGAMTPGISLSIVIRNTIKGSRSIGIVTALSHSLGIGFYSCLSVISLFILNNQIPDFVKNLSLFGAISVSYTHLTLPTKA